jgi:hypothetical protein
MQGSDKRSLLLKTAEKPKIHIPAHFPEDIS